MSDSIVSLMLASHVDQGANRVLAPQTHSLAIVRPIAVTSNLGVRALRRSICPSACGHFFEYCPGGCTI